MVLHLFFENVFSKKIIKENPSYLYVLGYRKAVTTKLIQHKRLKAPNLQQLAIVPLKKHLITGIRRAFTFGACACDRGTLAIYTVIIAEDSALLVRSVPGVSIPMVLEHASP